MELRKTYRFEASHILPKHLGKCSRLHGHSWVLHVYIQGSINPETGFVKDFAEMSKVIKPLVESLDHRHLGTWESIGDAPLDPGQEPWSVLDLPEEFYPTSENLLYWIGEQLLLKGQGINWSKLALEETCTSKATLFREEFNNERAKL